MDDECCNLPGLLVSKSFVILCQLYGKVKLDIGLQRHKLSLGYLGTAWVFTRLQKDTKTLTACLQLPTQSSYYLGCLFSFVDQDNKTIVLGVGENYDEPPRDKRQETKG